MAKVTNVLLNGAFLRIALVFFGGQVARMMRLKGFLKSKYAGAEEVDAYTNKTGFGTLP